MTFAYEMWVRIRSNIWPPYVLGNQSGYILLRELRSQARRFVDLHQPPRRAQVRVDRACLGDCVVVVAATGLLHECVRNQLAGAELAEERDRLALQLGSLRIIPAPVGQLRSHACLAGTH